MNTMKKDLASALKLSEGEERLLRELDAVRAERNKTVYALLEALKELRDFTNKRVGNHGPLQLWDKVNSAIANADLIVKSVNNFDALLEACKLAKSELARLIENQMAFSEEELMDHALVDGSVYQALTTAIANAER